MGTHEALAHLHDGLFDGRDAAFPGYFRAWPDQEAAATTLRAYEPLVIWGLFQTPAYANVLLYGDEKAVKARIERQTVLARDDPPRVFYVLPERVLRSRVGTAEVMHEQLMRLADAVSSKISVQVIPDGAPHPETREHSSSRHCPIMRMWLTRRPSHAGGSWMGAPTSRTSTRGSPTSPRTHCPRTNRRP
ncbi:hypothetical protein GCM10009678_56730 [Actinomadura kijaniata]